MKIRRGFVSNSSTTSFCIYGTWIDCPDATEEQFDAHEDIDSLCEENGLECHSMDGVSEHAVGLSPMDMNMDETRQQFQDRVERKIKELFKLENIDPGWIEETYYS